jgi:hypothetical protein
LNVKQFVIGAAAALALSAPAYAQSNTAAALVSEFVGVGEQATSTLGAMAAQHQALELQREQARQMQQTRQLKQDQAATQRHHCQPGYTGAVLIHADGTRELICEQRR